MNLLRLRPDPDPELTVIDLGLLTRTGLKAHRRKLRPPTPIAVRPDEALHLHQTAGEPAGLELAVKHHPVKPDFWCAPLEKLGKAIELTLSSLGLPRLPSAQPKPALDRLAIDPEFARNSFDAIAPFPTRDHLPHQLLP